MSALAFALADRALLDPFFVVDSLKDGGPDPTFILESTEMKGALASAVDSLPPQERTVISLYYFEGLTQKALSVRPSK